MSKDLHHRKRVKFIRKMKKDYTILSPAMAPIHFKILKPILQREGYNIEIMENEGPEVLQLALKYIHNDMCYPQCLQRVKCSQLCKAENMTLTRLQ